MSQRLFSQVMLDLDQLLAAWRFMDPSTRGVIITFGAIGLVTLLALLWAMFLRKSGRRRRSRHHAHQHSAGPAEAPEVPNPEGDPAPPQHHREGQRARRRRRSRNPTLAETGGLPPVRTDDPPDPRP